MAIQKPVLSTAIGLKFFASSAVAAAYLENRKSNAAVHKCTMRPTPFSRGSGSDPTSPNTTCLGGSKIV
ncbi:hypothetical protein QBC38DRAFT_454925 [Podospora fimiseda]|uniref:Uncharacterized protein n=1 Tax=Podospora fimiseda TaxID=252190 RepID=A0AAN7BQS7_9PEZI|nr:hypothetical protein QBC38DRAFT_454925 [Podospora fimiseda]